MLSPWIRYLDAVAPRGSRRQIDRTLEDRVRLHPPQALNKRLKPPTTSEATRVTIVVGLAKHTRLRTSSWSATGSVG